MSRSTNFFGVSSIPKGLRRGALDTYCRRTYSSNISGLKGILEENKAISKKGERGPYVKLLCDETCLRRASPISSSFSDGSGLKHSVSKSYQ